MFIIRRETLNLHRGRGLQRCSKIAEICRNESAVVWRRSHQMFIRLFRRSDAFSDQSTALLMRLGRHSDARQRGRLRHNTAGKAVSVTTSFVARAITWAVAPAARTDGSRLPV